MLSRNQRLSRSLFSQLLKNAHPFSSHLFICKWNKNVEKSRFAIVISRKINKKAAERNKKRRQVYEATRKNIHFLHNKPLHLIFFAKKTLETATFDIIDKEIIRIFQKIGR